MKRKVCNRKNVNTNFGDSVAKIGKNTPTVLNAKK